MKPNKRRAKPKPAKKSVPAPGRQPKPRDPEVLAVLDELPLPVTLTERQETFALEWLSNGFNASAAYRVTHPAASIRTSSVEGCRLLASPSVQAYLKPLIKQQLDARKVDAEEALAGIGDNARVDAGLLFDMTTGRLLEAHLWPPEIRRCIRSVVDGPYGLKITLESGFQARRLILEMAGKVKGIGDGFDALAAAIRADKAAHAHIPPAVGDVDA